MIALIINALVSVLNYHSSPSILLLSSLDPYYHSSTHRWHENNIMQFETRSTTGNPGTAMLRLSSVSQQGNRRDQIAVSDGNGTTCYSSEVGFSFIQLDGMWQKKSMSKTVTVNVYDYNVQPEFDQEGFLSKDLKLAPQVSFFLQNKRRNSSHKCMSIGVLNST